MNADRQDLSHRVRGEHFPGKPKDLLEVKSGMVTSKVYTRNKKMKTKEVKSKWLLAISVLTKFLLLLVAILWLGQLTWKWRDMLRYSSNPSIITLDNEGRLSEFEASLKSTSAFLQVQLDVVEKKLANEVENASDELKKQLNEKDLYVQEEIKRLEVRTDNLDTLLADLKGKGFLAREVYESFLREWKKSGSSGKENQNVNLDAVRELAKQIVEKEIEKHAADGLGMVDYALASGGAAVIRHSEPYTGKSAKWLTISKPHPSSNKMLEPSFGEPGQCFPMQGDNGFVEIRLKTGIVPEAVTLEHVFKSVAYDRSSAPKECRVYGWFEEPGPGSAKSSENMVLLTEFYYDLEKKNAQTFHFEAVNAGVINVVRFEFSSNHGNASLTCIYRFRVHGYEPNSGIEAAQA